jgi:hypothetical protein
MQAVPRFRGVVADLTHGSFGAYWEAGLPTLVERFPGSGGQSCEQAQTRQTGYEQVGRAIRSPRRPRDVVGTQERPDDVVVSTCRRGGLEIFSKIRLRQYRTPRRFGESRDTFGK